MTLKGLDGEVREYPTGTWMLKSLITDHLTKHELSNKILTGYSVSTVPREEAEVFKNAIESASMKSHMPKRVNIGDIVDPVAYTVSVVRKPCQYSAKFCDLKLRTMEDTELSENEGITKKDLEQGIKGAFKSLFKGEEETAPVIDTSNFALKSDLEDLKTDVIDSVKSEIASFKSEEDDEKKKKEKNNSEESGNNESNNNSSNNNTEEKNNTTEEGSESSGLTEEEEKEFQRLLAKRKKPQASNKSKSLNVHDLETISTKSENENIMQALGRTADGRYKGGKE